MTARIAAFLNALDREVARAALQRCCASRAWVETMLTRLPYRDDLALFEAADQAWRRLDPADWLEAFAAHPRIGDRSVGGWSRDEQAAMTSVPAETATRLEALNARYEQRFGHVFLISASNRTVEEMVSELERRLANDVHTELGQAAEEQRKITRLRLQKLVEP